jgi:hypothetical protein
VARRKKFKGPTGNPRLQYLAANQPVAVPLSVFEHLAEDSEFDDWERAARAQGWKLSPVIIRPVTDERMRELQGRRLLARQPKPDGPEWTLEELAAQCQRLRENLLEVASRGAQGVPGTPENIKRVLLGDPRIYCFPAIEPLWMAATKLGAKNLPPFRGEPANGPEAVRALSELGQSLLSGRKGKAHKPSPRGARPRYPRAVEMALGLMGQPGMTARKIHRLCKEKHGQEEPVPEKWETFIRCVRDHAQKRREGGN